MKALLLATPLATPSPFISRVRRHAAEFAVSLLIWSMIAFLISAQNFVAARVNGAPQSWSAAIASTLPWYGVWAVITPFIVWMARKYPYEPGRARRFILIHLFAGILCAVSHALLYVGVVTWLYHGNPQFPGSGALLAIKLSGSLHINLMTYAIIVGLVVAARAYRTLRDREVGAAKMEAQLISAEAAALRAQLQPHFLFNTLNAISGLVPNDPVRATRLIAGLGELLRLSIADDRRSTSTLADELTFMDAYLLVEQERLGERLRVEKRIDPNALGTMIPALLLQPLVENAIRHGIAPLIRGGTLTLSARLTASRLVLTVADDGHVAAQIRDGVGIGNTRRRLQHLYGQRHSFTVESRPDSGFAVTVEIPK